MNRRTALRHVAIISAGAVLMPSCSGQDKGSFPLKNITISGSEQEMLARLTETILPSGNRFPGADELKAHEFVMTMIDDCAPPEEQKKFTRGLKAFDQLSHDHAGQLFISLTTKQKKELLTAIENKNNIPEEALAFYETVKRYTIQNFTSSKAYMLTVQHYKMVPGPGYKGCVPV